MSDRTEFNVAVDRRHLFDTIAKAPDQDKAIHVIGHRLVLVLLAGDCDFRDAVALEAMGGIQVSVKDVK